MSKEPTLPTPGYPRCLCIECVSKRRRIFDSYAAALREAQAREIAKLRRNQ